MVVATGFFDGVHRGHCVVLDELASRARDLHTESIALTFWPHPRTVLQDGARELRLLTSLQEKTTLISSRGVDKVEVLPFTRDFCSLTAEQYLRDYVKGYYGADAIVLGYDNRLGSDLATPSQTEEIARSLGLEVFRPSSLALEGRTISSTLIRNLLLEGEVESAAELLGYSYGLSGVVVSGCRLGRTLGFRTANMQLYDPLKLIPGRGVYLVKVFTLGKEFFGMTNIGVRPTVSSGDEYATRTIETNIFDFDSEIYGLDISIRFLGKIRDEVRFPSLGELSSQLGRDREKCKKMIEEGRYFK